MDELLRIDPEFESKIPPLTEEEYQLLEENILQDGVVLNPLIVWNGCIIDGHNRFRIIQAHPESKNPNEPVNASHEKLTPAKAMSVVLSVMLRESMLPRK